MTSDYQQALGRKIAQHRRRRGLSQRELAGLVERSEAWVSQVERGVRRIDRMSVLETVADVLDVPLSDLAAEAPVVAAVGEDAPGARRLRLVLSAAHSLSAVLGTHPRPDVTELRERVEEAWSLTHAGRYLDLTEALEWLVPNLEAGVRSVPDARRAELFRLLASTYQACSAALTKLDESEAAWIASDRAIVAAERAGDPLLMAAGEFRLCLTFLCARHFDQTEATGRTAAEALVPLVEENNMEAASLFGALTLQRAVAAARSNDADSAYAHIATARTAAERLGADRNDFNTEFGPTNVALHEVAVAVDLGDAGVALRTARGVDASGLSPERRARMMIDVARAHLQRRHVDEAVTALEDAESVTPEQVRSHPLVTQTVTALLSIQDPAGPALAGIAQRIGVLSVRN